MADVRGTRVARWRDLLRLLPHAGRAVLFGVIAAAAVDAVLPLAIIATTGRLIARVTATPSVSQVIGPLIFLAALFTARQLLDPVRAVLVYLATSRIDGTLRERVMAATTRMAGVAVLEDPAMQDLVTQSAARPGPFRPATPGGAAVGMVGLGAKYAQGAGAALLIARFSPWLATAMLAGVALYRRPHHRDNLALARAFDDHLPSYRRAGYLSGLVVEPPAAKETRVFGLSRWILDRHTRVWTQVTGSMSALRHRTTRRICAYYLLMAPLNLVAFLIAGRAALDGRIDVGTLAVVLQASLQLLALGGLGFEEYQIDFGTAALPALAELEHRAAAAGECEPKGGRLVGRDQPPAVRFEAVSFAYPDGRQIFDDLNLTVPAGASLAIVGANGAGKTTLVKLLARLYEPTSGRILVDGVDVRELDLASWRQQLAVIFQDFVRYELGATENVGLGYVSRMDDSDALRSAARRAGSLAVIEELPRGWDTVLARGYTGGADLSGGEWQRVALARALFAVDGGAGVLALDEPTANLDVRAEAELFDHLLQVVSPGAEGGGDRRPVTTLLISHRFSTVRRADRICVLDAGRVVEEGTHDELVRAGGLYARMFSLQASRFDG